MAATEYRIRFVNDDTTVFEECNGESRPLTEAEYAENQYMKDGQPIPYDDYLAYYGNPERHVYLQSEVQKKCRCCGQWETVGGTGCIDFMDDAPELSATDQWIPADRAADLPGYLREIALEDLSEAGWRIPAALRCARKACRYLHAADSKYCAQHGAAQ
jgi:hypothetical protein